MPKTTTKNSPAWVDEQRYSIDDVLKLTGLNRPVFQRLLWYEQWKPQFPPKRGGGTGDVNRNTYTARDVMRLQVIHPAVRWGVHLLGGKPNPAVLLKLRDNLDEQIDEQTGQIAPKVVIDGKLRGHYIVPGFSPWSSLTFDLGSFVEKELKRLRK